MTHLPFFLVPGWRRIALVVAAPVAGLAALGGVALYHATTPPPVAPVIDAGVIPAAAGILVHVSGAVQHPGLYRLKRGDRVYAAIAAAGGLAPGADLARLPDLAGRLRDGEQVKVAYVKGAGGGLAGGKVDINTASASDLASVPGFTPEFAALVVEHRNRYGPFASIRELETVLDMPADAYALAKKYIGV
jgi:competence protein ComEA